MVPQGRSLKLNMRGREIKKLKGLLIKLGYKMRDDSHFDLNTEKAVKMFQKQHKLKITGEVNQETWELIKQKAQNAQPVNLTQSKLSEELYLEGRVTYSDHEVGVGLTIKAVHTELRREDEIGSGTTNNQGYFLIKASLSSKSRLSENEFQVTLQVYDQAMQKLGQSKIIKPLQGETSADIHLSKKYPFSEYEKVLQAMEPYLKNSDLEDLDPDPENADIRFLQESTGLASITLQNMIQAHQLAESSAVEPEYIYALLQQNIMPNRASLFFQHSDSLEQSLKNSVDQGIISEKSAEVLEQKAGLIQEKISKRVLSQRDPGQIPIADWMDAAAINPSVQEIFFKQYTQHQGSLSELWLKLEHDPVLGKEDRAAKIRLAAEIGKLVHNYLPLMIGLQSLIKERAIKQLKDLAALDPQAIKDVFATCKDPLPGMKPGADETVVRECFINNILQTLKGKFPNQYVIQGLRVEPVWDSALIKKVMSLNPDWDPGQGVSCRLSWQGLSESEKTQAWQNLSAFCNEIRSFPPPDLMVLLESGNIREVKNPLRGSVSQFLEKAEDFNILTTSIDRYFASLTEASGLSAEQYEETRHQLKRLQRVMRLTGDYNISEALLSRGLDSAMAITAMTQRTFSRKYASIFSEIEEAGAVYQKAESQKAFYLNLHAGLSAHQTSPGIKAIDDHDEPDLKSIPTLAELFGSMDLCECKDCQSLYSPSAYFVDLMQFLRCNSPTAYQTLVQRRPDLEYVLLSCENSHTPMPYVDLVNEILEVCVHLGEITAASTKNTQEITAEELGAHPQYLRAPAYAKLKNAFCAPELPFDLYIEISRHYLKHLGSSRAEIMWVFQDHHGQPADSDIALEYLNISPAEQTIISDIASAETMTYFGYNGVTTDYHHENEIIHETWQNNLSRVKVFMERAKIEFAQLVQLLETRFINPGQKQSPVPTETVMLYSPENDCDLNAMKIQHADNSSIEDIDWRRIHRFLRLWKKLDWPMQELDKSIITLGGQALDMAFIQKVARLQELSQALDLSIVQLLSFWNPMDTWGDDALFCRLFLNKKITNPANQSFALRSDGLELENTSLLLSNTEAGITAALRITEDELVDLRALTGLDDEEEKMTLDHLSRLYRNTSLAKALNLSIRDLGNLIRLTGIDPFSGQIEDLRLFIQKAEKIKSGVLSLLELNYIHCHQVDLRRNIAPAQEDVLRLLEDLRSELIRIVNENQMLPDPQGEKLREKLGLLFADHVLDQAMQIIDHYAQLPDENTFIDNHFSLFVVPNEVREVLAPQSGFDASERREFILKHLLVHLQDELSRQMIKQTLAESLALEPAVVKHLLEIQLSSVLQSNAIIMDDFLRLKGNVNPAKPIEILPAFIRLHKISLLVNAYQISVEELIYFGKKMNRFPDFNLNIIPVEITADTERQAPYLFKQWERIDNYYAVKKEVPQGDTPLSEILTASDHAQAMQTLSLATGWKQTDLTFLASSAGLDMTLDEIRNPTGWLRIKEALALSRNLGASAQTIKAWAHHPPDQNQAEDIIRTVKAKYSDQEWESKAKPLRDGIREQQRSALVAYMTAGWRNADQSAPELFKGMQGAEVEVLQNKLNLAQSQPLLEVDGIFGNLTEGSVKHFQNRCQLAHTGIADAQVWERLGYLHQPLRQARDLYAEFLIDVEMSPCMMTSRLKQAIASVQLFVQRCLMNLEPRVAPTLIDADQWEWMKNYRVWEANRKVFLYPENWIEPELRDNKSPFFKEMESELLQGEITAENVGKALREYTKKVNGVAHLEICAIYKQTKIHFLNLFRAKNILHIFGRTTESPYVYYHRTLQMETGQWSAWQKLDLDIEGGETGIHLIPAEWKNRMFLFWPVFHQKSVQLKESDLPAGFSSANQWEIRMAWSEFRYGTWQPKNLSAEKVFSPPFVYHLSKKNGTPLLEIIASAIEIDENQTYTSKTSVNTKTVIYLPPIENHFISIDRLIDIGIVIRVERRFKTQRSVFEGTIHYEEVRDYNQELIAKNYIDETGYWSHERPIQQYASLGHFKLPMENNKMSAKSVLSEKTNFCFNNGFTDVENHYNWAIGQENLGVFGVGWRPYSYVLCSVPQPFQVCRAQQTTNQGTETLRPFSYQDSMRTFLSLPTRDEDIYLLKFLTFFHPFAHRFVQDADENGADGLLRLPNQMLTDETGNDNGPMSWNFSRQYHPYGKLIERPYPKEDVDFGESANALYNWEMFFHIPLMIADRLRQDQKFEEAQKWFHFIFNPTDGSTKEPSSRRFWQLKPFRENEGPLRIKEWLDLLHSDDPDQADAKQNMLQQIEAWREDPFNPHLIARLRPVAYQKSVLRKYLDNLIAWADQLFRRDTMESINEATQLYFMAQDLLGQRPVQVPDRQKRKPKYYKELLPLLDAFSNALVDLENQFPYYSESRYVPYIPSSNTMSTNNAYSYDYIDSSPGIFGQDISYSAGYQDMQIDDLDRPSMALKPREPVNPGLEQVYYFCIPQNKELLNYWDVVEDRLFKIRHCMNIEGAERQLPLYQPPIDPALLVRARAMGLDIGSVLNDLSAPLPYYRFAYLQQKAMELCQEVKSLGANLLSALEKKDSEVLACLRAGHELELLRLMRDIKQQAVKEAEAASQALDLSKMVSEEKYVYYRDITNTIEKELNELRELENAQKKQEESQREQISAGNLVTHLPSTSVGTEGLKPTFSITLGLNNITAYYETRAKNKALDASQHSHQAKKSSMEASWERRWDEWKLQERVISKEIKQLEKQIAGAEIKLAIAEKDLENHEAQIESSAEILEMMKNKYTNQELYQWMSSQLSALFFQSYQLAYDMAKRAEKAFQHELGLTSSQYIQFGYWDSLKKGLLAGERLQLDIKRMESAYLGKSRREYELSKRISLAKLDPMALLKLKVDGRCELDLTEALFDYDFPGHYLRRIKNVSLTIPCIIGPYQNINCKLTLLNSKVRMDPTGQRAYPEDIENDDERFIRHYGATQSIATSHAQNDSGIFEVNFRDERYLPFEGAGAVSSWRIELDRECNQIDFNTITDVILHMRYTARDGGEALKSKAKEALEQLLKDPQASPLFRMLSLRHEYPSEWHRFLTMPEPKAMKLELDRNRFPYLMQSKSINIEQSELWLVKKDSSLQQKNSCLSVSSPEDQKWELEIKDIDATELEALANMAVLLKYTVS